MRLPRKPVESEIPTASMADIAFLLIIFFMVTAVFAATKGLEFTLPKEEEQQQAESEEAVFIRVNPDGSVLVDCKPMDVRRCEPNDCPLLEYLEPKLVRNPEKPVILYTDASATYQEMISVYDVLATPTVEAHGFKVKNISVPTQTEIQDYIQTFGYNPFESQCQ